jgi:uncharacterized protein YfbU (UPF0304 family)
MKHNNMSDLSTLVLSVPETISHTETPAEDTPPSELIQNTTDEPSETHSDEESTTSDKPPSLNAMNEVEFFNVLDKIKTEIDVVGSDDLSCECIQAYKYICRRQFYFSVKTAIDHIKKAISINKKCPTIYSLMALYHFLHSHNHEKLQTYLGLCDKYGSSYVHYIRALIDQKHNLYYAAFDHVQKALESGVEKACVTYVEYCVMLNRPIQLDKFESYIVQSEKALCLTVQFLNRECVLSPSNDKMNTLVKLIKVGLSEFGSVFIYNMINRLEDNAAKNELYKFTSSLTNKLGPIATVKLMLQSNDRLYEWESGSILELCDTIYTMQLKEEISYLHSKCPGLPKLYNHIMQYKRQMEKDKHELVAEECSVCCDVDILYPHFCNKHKFCFSCLLRTNFVRRMPCMMCRG